SPPRRPRRGGGFPRADGEHGADVDRARSTAAARADRAGVLRGDAPAVASRRHRPPAEAPAPHRRSRAATSRGGCRPAGGAGAGPQRAARGRGRPEPLRQCDGQDGAGVAGTSARGVRGMSVVTTIVGTTDVTILVYFLVLNSFYAVLLILSIPEIWEQTRLAEDEDFQRLMQSDALPPITILVPAYNERATIEASVTAILTLEYRNYEVVVVNDGSKDD